jgi:uncharacterized membrane protein YcaP (DUF421 family)
MAGGKRMWNELGMTWTHLWVTVASAVGVYVAMLALSRFFGQRQFATVASHDLAFNFAMGSLIGRTVLVHVSLLNAVVALVTMFALHSGVNWLHHHVRVVHRAVQNRPVLIVREGQLVDGALHRASTSRAELNQELRLAGFGSLEDVGFAVLERNGSFSVLGRSVRTDPEMFDEVVTA